MVPTKCPSHRSVKGFVGSLALLAGRDDIEAKVGEKVPLLRIAECHDQSVPCSEFPIADIEAPDLW
jgi:hypothetical protein